MSAGLWTSWCSLGREDICLQACLVNVGWPQVLDADWPKTYFPDYLASQDGVHRTAKELSKRMTQVEARDIKKPCNTDKNVTPLTHCTLWRCLWVLPMLKGSELHNVLMWDIWYHWGCCYRHQPSKPKCRNETIGRPYLLCALAVSAKRASIKILKIMNKSLDISLKRMIYYYLNFK